MTNTDIKKVHKKYFDNVIFDNFNLKENILYKIPIDNFAIGFCFEKSKNEKNSLYVWSFIQPLYVPNDSVSLSFGRRLGNKLWKLKGDEVLKSDVDELISMMKSEIDSFLTIDNINKFYNYFEHECKNLRMIEALVYSAVYSQNENVEMILDNFINTLSHENLSIKWISDIFEKMKYLKSILNDKNKLDDLFKKNEEYTKANIRLD